MLELLQHLVIPPIEDRPLNEENVLRDPVRKILRNLTRNGNMMSSRADGPNTAALM